MTPILRLQMATRELQQARVEIRRFLKDPAGFLQDPLGFAQPLEGITLDAHELPTLTREARMEGIGA